MDEKSEQRVGQGISTSSTEFGLAFEMGGPQDAAHAEARFGLQPLAWCDPRRCPRITQRLDHRCRQVCCEQPVDRTQGRSYFTCFGSPISMSSVSASIERPSGEREREKEKGRNLRLGAGRGRFHALSIVALNFFFEKSVTQQIAGLSNP